MYVHICVHTYIYACIRTYMLAYVHIHICVHTYTCIYACMPGMLLSRPGTSRFAIGVCILKRVNMKQQVSNQGQHVAPQPVYVHATPVMDDGRSSAPAPAVIQATAYSQSSIGQCRACGVQFQRPPGATENMGGFWKCQRCSNQSFEAGVVNSLCSLS